MCMKTLQCACVVAIKPNRDVQFLSMDNASAPGTVSFFSFPHCLSSGVTYIMDLKIEKFDVFIFRGKAVDRKQKSLPITVLTFIFVWPFNQFEFFSPLKFLSVSNFLLFSHLEQLEQNLAVNPLLSVLVIIC